MPWWLFVMQALCVLGFPGLPRASPPSSSSVTVMLLFRIEAKALFDTVSGFLAPMQDF